MNEYRKERNDQGFTLIELLVAIVVVGILTAVAIVGIAGLTNKGRNGACSATTDAVKAAEAVHYANTTPNVYPTTFQQMVTAGELELSGSTQIISGAIVGSGWTLSITTGGGANPMTFSTCPA